MIILFFLLFTMWLFVFMLWKSGWVSVEVAMLFGPQTQLLTAFPVFFPHFSGYFCFSKLQFNIKNISNSHLFNANFAFRSIFMTVKLSFSQQSLNCLIGCMILNTGLIRHNSNRISLILTFHLGLLLAVALTPTAALLCFSAGWREAAGRFRSLDFYLVLLARGAAALDAVHSVHLHQTESLQQIHGVKVFFWAHASFFHHLQHLTNTKWKLEKKCKLVLSYCVVPTVLTAVLTAA